jgi:PAS domain S-box-containing protein
MAYTPRPDNDEPRSFASGSRAPTSSDRLIELEEVARCYRELKRAMTDMMFVVDGTGRFLDMNERVTQRLGYGVTDLVAMRLYEVVDGDTEDPRQKMMPFFARTGGRQALVTRSGERVPVLVSSVSRYSEAGQFAGAVVVCREVKVEGTGPSALADTAQEMNQPLAGIYGYSELLKGSVGPRDPAYRYAKKIYEQSERLASLVRRIKAEQGSESTEPPADQPPNPGGQ